jgi:hypothetical protein
MHCRQFLRTPDRERCCFRPDDQAEGLQYTPDLRVQLGARGMHPAKGHD